MTAKRLKSEQIKPFWMGWKYPRSTYALRSRYCSQVLADRPWYRGMFFFNGVNSFHAWDKEGKYAKKSYPARTIIAK